MKRIILGLVILSSTMTIVNTANAANLDGEQFLKALIMRVASDKKIKCLQVGGYRLEQGYAVSKLKAFSNVEASESTTTGSDILVKLAGTGDREHDSYLLEVVYNEFEDKVKKINLILNKRTTEVLNEGTVLNPVFREVSKTIAGEKMYCWR